MNTTAIRALTFDVFGTVVDWRSSLIREGEALERAAQVVVIVGRGHQAPGGLADQVEALRPGTRQLIVDFVETEERASDLAVSENRIVWPGPPLDRPDPCAPLRAR